MLLCDLRQFKLSELQFSHLPRMYQFSLELTLINTKTKSNPGLQKMMILFLLLLLLHINPNMFTNKCLCS